MASLSVRKIDDDLYERLRVRAAEHGLSMEEEVRQILRRTLAAPEKLGQLAVRTFGTARGIDLTLPSRDPHDPLELEQ